MYKTIYICNVCGVEHDEKEHAIHCHPNIIEKKYKIEAFKNKGGTLTQYKSKLIEND